MDKKWLNVIKYFAWNAMLLGSLVIAKIFNVDLMLTIITVYYGFEAFCYFAFTQIPKDSLDDFYAKYKDSFRFYKFFFEPLYIGIAFCLGLHLIGIFMIITFGSYIIMYVNNKIFLSKQEEVKHD